MRRWRGGEVRRGRGGFGVAVLGDFEESSHLHKRGGVEVSADGLIFPSPLAPPSPPHLADGHRLIHPGGRGVKQLAQLKVLELIRHTAEPHTVQHVVQLLASIILHAEGGR